jgi:hypothetical protein
MQLSHAPKPALASPANKQESILSQIYWQKEKKLGKNRQPKKPENLMAKGFMLGWLMGLEPTTTGITIQGSTN